MREPSGLADRRHHAHRISKSRLHIHLIFYTYNNRGEHDRSRCYCRDLGKLLSWGLDPCRCSKRRKGRPRVDYGGVCEVGSRNRIYKWRSQAKHINRLTQQGMEPGGDWMVQYHPVVADTYE